MQNIKTIRQSMVEILLNGNFGTLRESNGNLRKNIGSMGIFLSKIWAVYHGIFQHKYGRNMGEIWEEFGFVNKFSNLR